MPSLQAFTMHCPAHVAVVLAPNGDAGRQCSLPILRGEVLPHPLNSIRLLASRCTSDSASFRVARAFMGFAGGSQLREELAVVADIQYGIVGWFERRSMET